MAFESYQLNLKLTEAGYQKVMANGDAMVSLSYIALGSGPGYSVDFRDTRTSLSNEVVRRQIDSHQREEIVDENGNNLARLDFAAIFSDSSSFDVWEIGFFDEAGDLIYIWSSTDEEYAPKRTHIHLVVAMSQYLLFDEEAANITVNDAGLPFELFLQPLKDDFEEKLALTGIITASSVASLTAKYMQDVTDTQLLKDNYDLFKSTTESEIDSLAGQLELERAQRIAESEAIKLLSAQQFAEQESFNISVTSAIASSAAMGIRLNSSIDEERQARLSQLEDSIIREQMFTDQLQNQQDINIKTLATLASITATSMQGTGASI